MSRPQQDMRVDIPAVGIETIKRACTNKSSRNSWGSWKNAIFK